jgi:hypothetical protein
MPTLDIVTEAILALKDRTGSSIPAITKWLATEKKVSFLESLGEYSDHESHLSFRLFSPFLDHDRKKHRLISSPHKVSAGSNPHTTIIHIKRNPLMHEGLGRRVCGTFSIPFC